jgi:hypothetical protein
LKGESLGNQATQAVQIHQMGKFQPVTKGAAGSDDGVAKAKRADGNAKVNISRRSAGVGSA